MSDNNNNPPNEFEDEAFDVEEEFEDVNLDETAYDEADFSEDVDGDVEYTDEDFAEEEWQDDEPAAMAADPNNKKLYRGGKEKKSFLSFNAIVIIGAVIVGGGVLAFTVMSKTQEANQAKGNIFRSMLNISEIMDGGLFGGNDEPAVPETPADDATATAQTPATDGGFLNNPDQLQTAEPPQPAPIAPEEGTTPNEPLTPMPEDTAQVPRTPDGAIAVDATTAPTAETPVVVEPATDNKAEELLKEAIANRETAAPEVVPAEPVDAAATPAVPTTPDVLAEPAPATPAEIKEEVKPTPVPETATAPVVDEQTKENVQALSQKLDDVLNRISNLENDLNTIKQSSDSTDIKKIEQSVQDLKQDLSEIKSRPATVVEKVVRAEPANDDVQQEDKPAPVKKKAPAKKAATPAKAPASASGKWELRAAQPGKAWVSKTGERDMRGVQIGETLPGIGQITGIVYQNGRWTVQGTQGQILQ
jgi:intracellular multiplication protein IcmG